MKTRRNRRNRRNTKKFRGGSGKREEGIEMSTRSTEVPLSLDSLDSRLSNAGDGEQPTQPEPPIETETGNKPTTSSRMWQGIQGIGRGVRKRSRGLGAMMPGRSKKSGDPQGDASEVQLAQQIGDDQRPPPEVSSSSTEGSNSDCADRAKRSLKVYNTTDPAKLQIIDNALNNDSDAAESSNDGSAAATIAPNLDPTAVSRVVQTANIGGKRKKSKSKRTRRRSRKTKRNKRKLKKRKSRKK